MLDLVKTIKFVRHFELSKQISLMIAVAFVFSVAARLYWIFWAWKDPNFLFNSQIMINTNDGYAFAEGARDIMAGFHQPNDLSYVWNPLSQITAFLAKILPFEFETVILYMSVFFSSLIVVPIILIANELKCIKAGFIAALIASVANSYYNRTMAGYYDTDMLNVVLAMFVLWGLIRLSVKNDKFCLFYIPIFTLVYYWWYASSFTLNIGLLGLFFVYTLIFDRKNLLRYEAMVLMLLALSNFAITVKIIAAMLLAGVFFYYKFSAKEFFAIAVAVFGVFVYFGGLDPIIFQAKFYIFRSVSDSGNIGFHFFNVNQTIRESGTIPLSIFMQRISSHSVVFIVSLIGYAILCFRHKEFILSLPILALGFLAVKSGLRFTIYSVPVMAMGFGYAVYYFAKVCNFGRISTRAFLLVATILALYPSLKHIYEYKTPTVFYQSEVNILNDFKSIAGREDYALSWWDYGYPLRYYSDVKTLIDGGKHLGNHNFPVSFALFYDQISSANMARLATEYTEMGFNGKKGEILENAMKDYDYSDISDLFVAMSMKEFKTPKKTREIYYYLPDRMLEIFSTVAMFSNLDLKDGKSYAYPFFMPTFYYGKNDEGFILDSNLLLSKDLTYIKYGSDIINLNQYIETSANPDGTLNVTKLNMSPNGQIYVIFMKEYGRFLLLDKKMFNSTFIQLFVLENYDKTLFEPVILRGEAKIYRLKK